MISVCNITNSYISEVLKTAAPSHRPGAQHLACTVCGGSFLSRLSVVQQCEHCNGMGLEPKPAVRALPSRNTASLLFDHMTFTEYGQYLKNNQLNQFIHPSIHS